MLGGSVNNVCAEATFSAIDASGKLDAGEHAGRIQELRIEDCGLRIAVGRTEVRPYCCSETRQSEINPNPQSAIQQSAIS